MTLRNILVGERSQTLKTTYWHEYICLGSVGKPRRESKLMNNLLPEAVGGNRECKWVPSFYLR